MSDYDPKYPILREMLAFSLMGKLEECGFEEIETDAKTSERVFSRSIPNANINVSVYTTVVGQQVRSSGKDAIRVCATYNAKDGTKKGIVKATRVHRTGNIDEIVDRMHSRMRETWKAASTGERCSSCGAPKFIAKSGNRVCADICWVSPEQKKTNQSDWKRNKKTYRKRKRY
jgi:hypothetical protein